MFTIPLLHSDIATWWGQDFSVAPIPTRRKGFCFWPLLPCCAMKVHSCRFWLLCSSLCSASGIPHLFYCWLYCRNWGAVRQPSKAGERGWWWMQGSWKQTAGLSVVSLSPCGDSSLPIAAIPPHFGIIYASWAVLLLSTLLYVCKVGNAVQNTKPLLEL